MNATETIDRQSDTEQASQPVPGPAPPNFWDKAWNLAETLAAFVADGCQTTTRDEFAARLRICEGCDSRHENVCLACGCYLPLKARLRAADCPLEKWPKILE